MQYVAMILDQETKFYQDLTSLFAQHDMQTINCATVDKVYSVLEKTPIDVIIIDIDQHQDSAFQLIQKLKNSEYKDIPIVINTQNTNKAHYFQGITAGASDYVIRPFNAQWFLDRVFNLLKPKIHGGVISEADNIQPVTISWDFQDFIRTELKRADRGDYPVTIVMATACSGNSCLEPAQEDFYYQLTNQLVTSLKLIFRETDTIVRYGSQTLIAILPFCQKTDLSIITDKIKQRYTKLKSLNPNFADLNLIVHGLTYPNDGISREEIFSGLEKVFLADL